MTDEAASRSEEWTLPPAEGWSLREALFALLDPEDWVRFSLAEESSRYYESRVLDLADDPDPRDQSGRPIDVATLRQAHRRANEQLWSSSRQAIRRLREAMTAGVYTAFGRRQNAFGDRVELPDDAWSAFDWLDLESSAIGEGRNGGSRFVAVRIFAERREAHPRRSAAADPYEGLGEAGDVARAFDVLRPEGRRTSDRNDALFDEIRNHLATHFGYTRGRPGNTIIKKGIGASNRRHGR